MGIFKKHPDTAVVYSKAKKFDTHNHHDWFLPNYSAKEIITSNMVFCSGFYRKSDWEKLGGYNKNMKDGLEDWDFWLYFTERGMKFYCIPEVLFYYRQINDGQEGRHANFNNKNRQQMLKKLRGNHPTLYKFFWMQEIGRFFYRKKVNTCNGKVRIKICKLKIPGLY